MRYPFQKLTGPMLFAAAIAISAAPANAPVIENEQVRYNINWPSGLSLGEAQLRASISKPAPDVPGRLHLEFTLDAGIPGFAVSDQYRSEASTDFCSAEFQRTTTHGPKKTDEKTTFDQQNGTASRETPGGGKSELQTPACAKDALTFLYYVRHELSQGRMPPRQTMFFGASYEIRIEFIGTQKIPLGEKQAEADRVTASVKGPSSEINFEVFFLKDPARTPALVRVPLAIGTFSMELVR
ncbi:MAG TPA: DUF3108 domain-containing protein [Bryobacteraceae bacterium]|jgi:hypothetical protein|nr:DUF3108 domain-containing protein [Bryobacteraceae bacterium]